MWTVSDKVIRYQLRIFKGLSALIRQTDYYQKSREKNSALDKANWLVSYIIDTNLKTNSEITNYVNISSKKLKSTLGNKYLDVINALVDQGLIVSNNKYSVNRYSKSYRLTSKLYKGRQIKSVEIKSKRFSNRLDKLRSYDQHEVLKNPLYVKIISNTLKISFINDFVHYIPMLNQ